MEAQNLNCPNCGAAVSSDSPRCRFCESKLATVACPSCFAMMFIGSKHCPHCGAAATQAKYASLSVLRCPRCKVDMSSAIIGNEPLRECERCGGLWLEAAVFEKICLDREQQSAVLGTASLASANPRAAGVAQKISYLPCPQCGQLMNRINFARCSGVVVDVCKGHGTWFDREELREIVEFIRGGGFEVARQREKLEIEFQREQLRGEQSVAARRASSLGYYASDDEKINSFSGARGLLKFLIDD